MPIRFEKDEELLKIILEGEIFLDDLYAGVDEIYKSEVPEMVLWDMRLSSAGEVPDTATLLQEFSTYATERGKGRTNGRVALLSPNNFQYGLSRMSTAYAEQNHADYSMQVFREELEALAWLRQET